YPNSQRTESYAYSDGGIPAFSVFSNGTLTSYHQENPAHQVDFAASVNERAIYGYSGASSCGSGSAAASCRYAQRRTSSIPSARWGGVLDGTINFSRNYTLHWTDFSTAPKLYEYEDTCTGGYFAGASPRTFRWEWTPERGSSKTSNPLALCTS